MFQEKINQIIKQVRKVAYLDEIIFWIVPEVTTRLAGLISGEYDVHNNDIGYGI